MCDLFLNDYYNSFNFLTKLVTKNDIFIGMSLFQRFDGYDISSSLVNVFFILRRASLKQLHVIDLKMGRICSMEFGLTLPLNYLNIQRRLNINIISFAYLCGVDFESYYKYFCTKYSFVVFQGLFHNIFF